MVTKSPAESNESTIGMIQNNNNHHSGDSESRKPFITVVQEWSNALRTELKVQNPSKQQIDLLDDEETKLNTEGEQPREDLAEQMDEWRREISQFKTEHEKFLHVCKKISNQADDHSTSILLKELLAEYPNFSWHKVTDKQQSNCTLLHLLAQKNRVRCMEILLATVNSTGNNNDAKARNKVLDATDSISSTPLLYAIAHNAEEATAFLLSKGTLNMNAKDIYNKFPLLLALRNKNYKIAELLLGDRNTDIHLRGTKGNTVLHTMVEEGDLSSVKFLVEKGASAQRRNNEEENVLFHSLPHYAVADYLAQHFSKKGLGKMLTNVNTFGQNIFHKVACDGFFDNLLVILGSLALGDLTTNQVQTLLNTQDKNGDTPLILAAKAGRRDMVQFLCLCKETQINDGDRAGNTALHYAAASKDQEMTAILTKYGASFKATNSTDDKKEISFFKAVSDRVKSLSTVLTLMLAVFAIICILSVAAVCIAFFATNISSSAAQVRERAFGEVVDYLEYSISTQGVIQSTSISQVKDKLDVLDEEDSFRFVYTIFQANYKTGPSLFAATSIRLADAKSVGVSINSVVNGTTDFLSYTSYSNPDKFFMYIHPDLDRSWKSFNLSYSPTSIVKPIVWKWINTSRNMNSTYWTDPYLKRPLTSLFYSLITPFHEEGTGKYLGYFSSDATVATITEYLAVKASEQYDSSIAILETKTQNMVAVSDSKVAIYSVTPESDGTDITRFKGTTSSDKRLAGMTRFIEQKYGSGSLVDRIKPKEKIYKVWYMDGKRQAINIYRLTDDHGLDWIVCQTLPTSIFYKTFGISIGVMAGLTLILLLLGIILSTIAARLFMRPIFLLIQQADDIKMLQLDKVETELSKSTSYFTEVKSLQESYKSMTARLKQFRQFIPAHILSVIEAEISSASGLALNDKKYKSQHMGVMGADGIPSSGSHSDHLSTSGIHSKGMVNRALKSKLSSGAVTVMTIRFPDMEEILEQYSADDLSETTKDLISATRTCIQESNGQLVNMTSKKVIIAWNTFISQSDHRQRACRTARQVIDELQKLHKQWTQKHLPLLEISIGISSGVVYFGNIGSDSTKFFTIIGRPSKQSDRLCVQNKHWGTQILVSDDVFECAKDEFYLRPVGNKFEEDMAMYELGNARNTAEEWVEEINRNDPNDKWQTYREAYEHFHREQYSESMQLFTAYLNQNPHDVVCQKMIAQCQDQSSLISTGRTEPDLLSSTDQ